MNKFSERRLVENEVIFREANKSVQQYAQEINDGDRKVPFFCECSNALCRDRILMSAKKYGDQHKNKQQFMVLPSHETPQIEKVVKREKNFFVLEKLVKVPSLEEIDSAISPH